MCGIAGTYWIDPSRPADETLVRRMTGELRHRGPDDEGYFTDRNIGLGFRRLAIIDLSRAGNQPMTNEDGSLRIVFNGEFYGYLEIARTLKAKGHVFRSKSDTETILHLFEEEGIGCLSKIDGMFAFALWDARRSEFYLVRDRLGIKPLYYYRDNDRILFGSEIKAILADPSVPRVLNEEALSDYLAYMTVPGPATIYRNIFKLPPAHYLHVAGSSVRQIQYWDIPTVVNEEITESAACETLEQLLGQTVRDQMVSDVPLGAFLSGGVDSSAVVAMMARGNAASVKTFAIAFPGSPADDESPVAQRVASLLHTDHRSFAVTPDLIDVLPKLAWYFDEPFAVSSAFATYFLARETRKHVTVALTGDGGDELFAGYPFRYSMDRRHAVASLIPAAIRRTVAGSLDGIGSIGPARLRDLLTKLRTYAGYLRDDADRAFVRSFTFFDEEQQRRVLTNGPARDPLQVLARAYRHASTRDRVNRRLYGDLKTTLPDEMLTKVDRMTMSSGLEARVPLLDHRLVEFVATLPGSMKIRGRNGKRILKQALRNHLPADILKRRKHGFNVPMASWLRKELFTFMTDLLSEDTIRRRGYFDPAAVQRLIDDHRNHRANNVGQLYILLSFELWHRAFMDSGH